MNGNKNYMHNGFGNFSEELMYPLISPNHPLMRLVSNVLMKIQKGEATEEDYNILARYGIIFSPWEASKDTCKSKPMSCYIHDPATGLTFAANNGINRRQDYCVRHFLQNDVDNNYVDCRLVCLQPAHAEIMVVIDYLLHTGILTYRELINIFPNTINADDSLSFGIVTHDSLLKFIKDNDIKLDSRIQIFLYGQEKCCDNCAHLLLELGVKNVRLSPTTHKDEKRRRNEIHSHVTPEDELLMRSLTHNPIPELRES